jgi:hypothetical protein
MASDFDFLPHGILGFVAFWLWWQKPMRVGESSELWRGICWSSLGNALRIQGVGERQGSMSELGIYRRVAQAFDVASITNIVGAPFFAFFAKAGVGNAGGKWV